MRSSVFSITGMIFLFGFVYPQLQADSIYVVLGTEMKTKPELANDVAWAGLIYFACLLTSLFFIYFPGKCAGTCMGSYVKRGLPPQSSPIPPVPVFFFSVYQKRDMRSSFVQRRW